MYAIVEISGHQVRVEQGSRLDVNRLSVAVGAEHTVERVLLARNGQGVLVGQPYVTGAKIIFEVIEHRLGPKVVSFKFRRRENYRRTVGHRQTLTRLLVKELVVPGHDAPATGAKTRPAAGDVKNPVAPRKVVTAKRPTTKSAESAGRSKKPEG